MSSQSCRYNSVIVHLCSEQTLLVPSTGDTHRVGSDKWGRWKKGREQWHFLKLFWSCVTKFIYFQRISISVIKDWVPKMVFYLPFLFVVAFWDKVSLNSPDWPRTQNPPCLSIPTAGITSTHNLPVFGGINNAVTSCWEAGYSLLLAYPSVSTERGQKTIHGSCSPLPLCES